VGATALDKWYGKDWRERTHYGTTLHAGVTQGVKAVPDLLALAQDPRVRDHARDRGNVAATVYASGSTDGGARIAQDNDPEVRIAR